PIERRGRPDRSDDRACRRRPRVRRRRRGASGRKTDGCRSFGHRQVLRRVSMIAGAPAPIQAIIAAQPPADTDPTRAERSVASGNSFAATLAAMTDGVAGAVGKADRSAAMLASGNGDIAAAAIARAKADVALEIASVAASRASSAITSLLQTQS